MVEYKKIIMKALDKVSGWGGVLSLFLCSCGPVYLGAPYYM